MGDSKTGACSLFYSSVSAFDFILSCNLSVVLLFIVM
jgi:hypothetical protein